MINVAKDQTVNIFLYFGVLSNYKKKIYNAYTIPDGRIKKQNIYTK